MTMTTSVLLLATLSSLAEAEPADEESLDPDKAFELSAIGAAAPAAVAGAGALMVLASGGSGSTRDNGLEVVMIGQLVGLVTPSLGDFYSHQIATGGLAMRVGGLLVETAGLFEYYNTGIGDCAELAGCHHPAQTYAMIFGGAALFAGGMLYDAVRARGVASAWNRQHDVVVVPTALKTQGAITPGVALAMTF